MGHDPHLTGQLFPLYSFSELNRMIIETMSNKHHIGFKEHLPLLILGEGLFKYKLAHSLFKISLYCTNMTKENSYNYIIKCISKCLPYSYFFIVNMVMFHPIFTFLGVKSFPEQYISSDYNCLEIKSKSLRGLIIVTEKFLLKVKFCRHVIVIVIHLISLEV